MGLDDATSGGRKANLTCDTAFQAVPEALEFEGHPHGLESPCHRTRGAAMSKAFAVWGGCLVFVSRGVLAQEKPSRESWGAPEVQVSQADGKWTIAGKKQTVVIDAKDLSTQVRAGSVTWNMVPSGPNDMIVKGVI